MIFMQILGMLVYNLRNDLQCSSLRYVRKVDIIDVFFDNLECDMVYGNYYNFSIYNVLFFRSRQYDKIN